MKGKKLWIDLSWRKGRIAVREAPREAGFYLLASDPAMLGAYSRLYSGIGPGSAPGIMFGVRTSLGWQNARQVPYSLYTLWHGEGLKNDFAHFHSKE